MPDRDGGETPQPIWMSDGEIPSDSTAPVVSYHVGTIYIRIVEDREHVFCHLRDDVGAHVLWLVGSPVPPQVGGDHAVTGSVQNSDLVAP